MTNESARRAPALLLLIALFLANAAIMVLELCAGKLITRYLGMSLHTWTAVIGIVLAGMAAGNFLGGWLADRTRPLRTLAVLLLLSGGAAAATLPLNGLCGEFAALAALPSWPLRIVLHVLGVFFLPCVALGAISPVLARALLAYGRAPGRTAGIVFGLGVLGALVGTFITGYWLVMLMGISKVILLSSGVLSALGGMTLLAALLFDDPRPASAAREAGGAVRSVPQSGLWIPAAAVFVSNAVFMAIELAAIRIMAREFGTSIYTWTTAIGVVLAAVSAGNFIGGWLADRIAPRRLLASLFLLASVSGAGSLLLGMFCARALDEVVPLMTMSWPAQILMFSLAMLLLPCLLLGMVSPAAAAWRLHMGVGAGRAFGDVYAWGSAGSIVATFATGYLLIDLIGSRPLIAVGVLVLACAAVLLGQGRLAPTVWAAVAAALVVLPLLPQAGAVNASRGLGLRPAFRSDVVWEDESQYSYVAVSQDSHDPNLRNLVLDKLEHSKIDLRNPDDFKQEYEWIYQELFERFLPGGRPLHLFFIGGGGYVFPRHFAKHRPGGLYYVAEIDPAVTRAAQAGMGLGDPPGFPIFHGDARNAVEDLVRRKRAGERLPVFDAVIGDSFNDFSVPQHLVTLEFTQKIFELLSPEGLYVLNMIDMLEPGNFLGAVAQTVQEVFPFVYVFNGGSPPTVRDTFVVVCAKQALNLGEVPRRLQERHAYRGGMLAPEVVALITAQTGHMVLTDDYAPTELLLMPVARSAGLGLAQAYLESAASKFARGAREGAIAAARRAVELAPDWLDSREYLGDLLAVSGDLEGAVREWLEAAARTPEGPRLRSKAATELAKAGRSAEAMPLLEAALREKPSFAHIAVTLGVNAFQAGDAATARGWWELALRHAPEDVLALYNMGNLAAAEKRYDEAIAWWQRAVAVNPAHMDSLHNLALAYLYTRNFAAAQQTVAAIRAQGGTPDPGVVQAIAAGAAASP